MPCASRRPTCAPPPSAAAAIARNDLADTKKLLAPLEVKPGTDSAPESDAVKADRARLSDQAAVSESQIKQCEVVIARADQLIERLTKLRGQVMLDTLLRRDASPLSREIWSRLGPQFAAAVKTLGTAMAAWSREGLSRLHFDNQDLTSLAAWAALTVALWGLGHFLRRRFGRGDTTGPGKRDRTLAVAIDGVGLVLVPILAIWLIGKLLAATAPPAPIDILLPELIVRVIAFLLVVGLTATALAPHRPAWRVLPFTNDSAAALSFALRRLMAVGLSGGLHLCRPDPERRRARCPVGGRRPGAGHRHLAAHPADARQPRLARHAAPGAQMQDRPKLRPPRR